MRERFGQVALFCSCGQGTPAVAGLCRACYRSRQHSLVAFGGQREAVLHRDHASCQICSRVGKEARPSARRLHVHHRRPGVHDPAWLVSLCAACHARVHRTLALRVWLPEPLVELWIEQHPGVPVQLQFPR